MFDRVRSAPLELQPPELVSVMKFFLKRLKPEKPEKGTRASVIESTGVREYCLPSGPITAWFQTDQPATIAQAFGWLRRLRHHRFYRVVHSRRRCSRSAPLHAGYRYSAS